MTEMTWRSVIQEKPAPGVKVLAMSQPNQEVYVMEFDGKGWYLEDGAGWSDWHEANGADWSEVVTHWMPLPPAQEEQP